MRLRTESEILNVTRSRAEYDFSFLALKIVNYGSINFLEGGGGWREEFRGG